MVKGDEKPRIHWVSTAVECGVRIRDAEHGQTATQLAGNRLAETQAQAQLPAFKIGEVEEGISEKAQVDRVCAEGCKGTCEVRVGYAKVAYGHTRVGGSRVEREGYSKGRWRCVVRSALEVRMESMRVHAGRIRRLARRAQWQDQQQDGRSRLRGSEDGAIRMVRSCHFGTGVAGCYSGATSQGEARQRGSQAWRLPDDGSVNEYCKYMLKSEMCTHTLARTTSHNDGDI